MAVTCTVCGRENGIVMPPRILPTRQIPLCAACIWLIGEWYDLRFPGDHASNLADEIRAELQKEFDAKLAEEKEKLAGHKIWQTYFIASQKYVKIGKAYNPEARLVQLNRRDRGGVVCPEDLGSGRLVLLGSIEGDYEANFHSELASYRVVGEWFHRIPKLEAVLRRAVA